MSPRSFRHPILTRIEFGTLLSRLMVEWSNLESFLALLLSTLLKTDRDRAAIVFYGTSQPAKRDLLWRLFVVFVDDKEALADFANFLVRFKRVTTTRNKYAHAIYSFGDEPADDFLNSIRFPNEFDGSKSYVTAEYINKRTIAELKTTAEACAKLNGELQALIKRVEPLVQGHPVVPLQVLPVKKTRGPTPQQKRPSPASRRKVYVV